jgi:hypothetical protein
MKTPLYLAGPSSGSPKGRGCLAGVVRSSLARLARCVPGGPALAARCTTSLLSSASLLVHRGDPVRGGVLTLPTLRPLAS